MKVVLVCTGNTCRSPMAAALLRKAVEDAGLHDVEVASAGLSAFEGDPVSSHSVTVMARRGIDISGHRARRLTEDMIRQADLILVMTAAHKRYLENWEGLGDKVFTIKEFARGASEAQGMHIVGDDVIDPIGQSLEVYEKTAQELEVLAGLVVKRLLDGREEHRLRVIIGNDHAGVALVKSITGVLGELGVDFQHVGTFSEDSVDYPDYAVRVSEAVARGEFDRGILICGTGIGMSITANKVPGIRAALCTETYSAALSRLHNDANVLCLGARVLGPGLAEDIVRIWMTTKFSGDRHQRRVDKINSLDRAR